MKKFTFLFLLFFVLNNLNAQFSLSAFPETVNTLDNICFYNSKIFLVNADPNTLLTLDGGKNLIKINSPGYYNNAVAINDSTFIVSLYNRFKITYNRGINWNDRFRISDNGDTIKNSDMVDFYIFNNGKGFITNYIQKKIPQVYITKNWGETWGLLDSIKNKFTARDYKSNNFLKKQYNFDSTSYVMKQSSDSILVKYSNYGENVSEINLAEKGINQKVLSIAFKDENNGIISTTYSSTQTQKLYITSDGCKSFTEITKPTENFLKIEYAKATTNKKAFYFANFLTSIMAEGTGGSFYSENDGKTWNKNKDDNYLRTVNFYNAETGIVTIGRDVNFKTNIFYFTGNTTNISEINKLSNNITLFPNPATNTLNLNILEAFGYTIINLQGQVMQHEEIKNASNSINISKLETGVYVINLTTETGYYYCKFIKSGF